MEETGTVAAAEQSAATSITVDGLELTIDKEASASWDAVMLSRDIYKLRGKYAAQPDGDAQAEIVLDAVALMYEYVLLVTDLTREKIAAHLGTKASFAKVSEFLGHVMQEARAKN